MEWTIRENRTATAAVLGQVLRNLFIGNNNGIGKSIYDLSLHFNKFILLFLFIPLLLRFLRVLFQPNGVDVDI